MKDKDTRAGKWLTILHQVLYKHVVSQTALETFILPVVNYVLLTCISYTEWSFYTLVLGIAQTSKFARPYLRERYNYYITCYLGDLYRQEI